MAGIYKLNDIRGIYNEELTQNLVVKIGYYLSSFFGKGSKIVIAGDSRLSTPSLVHSIIQGLNLGGVVTYNMGMGPTPLVYYASITNDEVDGGIMITASHNPKIYNGIKVCDHSGLSFNYENLYSKIESSIYDLVLPDEIPSNEMDKDGEHYKLKYFEYLKQQFTFQSNPKVIIEFGNGCVGPFGELLKEIGCDVQVNRETPDGNFPTIIPDPAKEKTYTQIRKMMDENPADIGIAFDGDGDRVGFMLPDGEIISPDQVIMLYAKELIERKGDASIIIDVKMSNACVEYIKKLGGKIEFTKTGHSWVHKKLININADIAAELSCHYYFEDQYYGFDDGLYSALRFIQILDRLKIQNQSLVKLVKGLPKYITSKEYRDSIPKARQIEIINRLKELVKSKHGRIIDIDGIRGEFENGWFITRMSGTEEALSYRFEGKTENDYLELKNLVLNIIKPN